MVVVCRGVGYNAPMSKLVNDLSSVNRGGAIPLKNLCEADRREWDEIVTAWYEGRLTNFPSRKDLARYLQENPDGLISSTLQESCASVGTQAVCERMGATR